MKIAFIGGGNMGEAMLTAILSKKLAIAKDITVSDVSEARRQTLSQKYTVNVSADNIQTITGKDIIVLAVKPQAGPAEEYRPEAPPGQAVKWRIKGRGDDLAVTSGVSGKLGEAGRKLEELKRKLEDLNSRQK